MKFAGPDDAIYRLDGATLLPTEFSQGPWDPKSQHGGAVAALFARCIEAAPSAVPMRVMRMSIDLMRGVPMTPLHARTRIVRDGRRIQVVDVSLFSGELETARASALRIRTDPSLFGGYLPETAPRGRTRTRPGEGSTPSLEARFLPGFIRAVDFERETEAAPGGLVEVWSRLRCRVVEGETPSPFVRLAAGADFTNGTASPLDFEKWMSINPDLTIHAEREVEGEWVAVEGYTVVGRDATAQSFSVLHDLGGPVGRAEASVLVDAR